MGNQVWKKPSENKLNGLVRSRIESGTLIKYAQDATPAQQLDKSQCVFHLLEQGATRQAIDTAITKCLVELNMQLASAKRMEDHMYESCARYIMKDYNGIPLPAIVKVLDRGIRKKLYGALDTQQVLTWLEEYVNNNEHYNSVRQEAREKHDSQKEHEFKSQNHNLLKFYKAVEDLNKESDKKKRNEPTRVFSEKHLSAYAAVLEQHMSDEQLQQALERQKGYGNTQKVDLIIKEQLKRQLQKDGGDITKVSDKK